TTLTSGENDLSWDAGLVAQVQNASLGDKVWLDKDCDGIQDEGEAGLAGVTVNLLDATGATVGTTSTDAAGEYLFTDLVPGTYSVSFTAPSGYIFTDQDAAADDVDSDANANGVTGQYVLAAGDNNLTVDAGLVEYTTTDVSFNFNGSSSGAGTYGNIRSYTENGVTVNASAFSRNDSSGQWDTAYLGTFSGGLGVTNRGESGSGSSHTVDNNGADDYVLFEFSDTVTIDSAFLGYVVNDSDMSVWVGTVDGAFDSHLTLSDSVLADMGFSEVSNGSSSTRLADLNADELAGNVLIIAAKTTSSNDYFKIQHLNVQVKESVCESGDCAPIVIEAEDMHRCDYSIESNSAASGGAVVKLSDYDGYVKTTFDGPSGNYDFTLNYIDENDGYGMLKIKVNGTTVKTINLDQQVGDHTNGFTSVTIDDLQLNKGDVIKISGWFEGSEYARIDSIVLKNCDTTPTPTNEAPEDGDECVTVSESDGRQTLATNALANATDADGDSVFVKSLEGEDLTNGGDDWDVAVGDNGGLLYIYADGTVEFDTNSEFDALNTGETAATSFTYVVSDGNGGENQSTYKVVVNGEGAQKASLGDRVWNDRDQDGYQDSSESGINSVRLDLYKWTGSTTVWAAKTYTDANGDYSFNNLDEGYYYIRADKSTLPYGYEFTGKDWASDSSDSDVNNSGYTSWIWLDEGEQDNSWDVGAYYCPIVVDLDGDGVQTLSVEAGTSFDMDNDGSADSTGWISGSDAFIVHDANGNGVIDNRSEMFGGDNTGDGFRKLAAFDTNGDGVIDLSDDAFAQLQVWQDANENGITDAGELSSLADAGLAELDVQFETRTEGAETDQNGNRLLDWSTAEQTDGSKVDLVDVYFAKGDGIDLSNVESLESSVTSQTSLSSLDLGMDQNEFAYDGAVSNAFDALDIPDMAIIGTADEHQIV
ncbi:MAG: SdrD B-like domain-containing protein, partial [Pseudomonadales bacterium]